LKKRKKKNLFVLIVEEFLNLKKKGILGVDVNFVKNLYVLKILIIGLYIRRDFTLIIMLKLFGFAENVMLKEGKL